MRILAIDPGPERSAWVSLESTGKPLACSIDKTDELIAFIRSKYLHEDFALFAIEMPQAMGQRVGNEVFATCRIVGRMQEAWVCWIGKTDETSVRLVSRKDVTYHFCGKRNVPGADAAIRQCLIDRYGPGKSKAIGTKKSPGPLYGIKQDLWQALAVGLYVLDTMGEHV